MYERRKQPLLSKAKFLKRVARHWLAGFGVLALGLGGGILGYHYIAGLSWIDSLLNASMILGGMGPVDPLKTNAAKIFASCYALFSGLAFIGIVSVLLAPFVHRLLHRFLHAKARTSRETVYILMYVSGAFFPLGVLPVWLQIPARVLPTTESIELTRAFLTGRFLPRHLYEAAYLVISAIVAGEWAMRSLRKRMVA